MKRSSFTGFSIFFLLFITTGCKKISHTSQPKTVENTVPTKQQDLRMWWDSGREPGIEGLDYGCEGIGGNCLPDATVTPKPASLLADFAQSINPEQFASVHYSNLVKLVDKEILDLVVNGKVVVSMRGEIAIGKCGYLKFSYTNGTVLMVYPFKL